MLHRRIHSLRQFIADYPNQFWTLVAAGFVDRLGGGMLFTFFAVYVTRRFDVGLTEAGYVFAIFGFTGVLGSFLGGAITDKFGRRGAMVVGLVMSAFTTLVMGLVDSLLWLYVTALIAGIFFEFGEPARQALLTEILPEDKQAEGFGILRVGNNLAMSLGPVLGALVVAYTSYLYLFLADAITSTFMGVVVLMVIRETHKPNAPAADGTVNATPSIGRILKDYRLVFQDRLFMSLIGISLMVGFVYTQMYSTLSVFLYEYRAQPEQVYGYLLSMNAALVVLTQFSVTRMVRHIPKPLVLVAAALLYAVGFSMFGYAYSVPLYVLAMLFITVGEMLQLPTGRALVSALTEQQMRGRYMAIWSMSYVIPSSFGTVVAGLVTDNFNPNWLWFGCGIVALMGAAGYGWLYKVLNHAEQAVPKVA